MKANKGIQVSGQGNLQARDVAVGDHAAITHAPEAGKTEKRELEQLLDRFLVEFRKVPAQFAEERQLITRLLSELRQEASKDKPSTLQTRITAKGLREAAEAVGGVVPGLVKVARSIVERLI